MGQSKVYHTNLKGMEGEAHIKSRLEQLQLKYDFFFIYDFPVERANRTFEQCDFLIISVYGYFVLEVKNWIGTLTCFDCEKSLELHTPNKGCFRVLNPVLQNASHVKHLRDTLRLDFQNIVLFADTCTLVHPTTVTLSFSQLENIFKYNEPHYDPENVERDYARLYKLKEQNALRSIASRYTHIYGGRPDKAMEG